MSIIHLHNGTFYTSDQLFEAGQGACCECGCPQPRTNIICNRCGKALIVIRDKYIPQPFIQKIVYINGEGNAARKIKIAFVHSLIRVIEKELKKEGITHLSICPHETYLKIYPASTRGNGWAVNHKKVKL